MHVCLSLSYDSASLRSETAIVSCFLFPSALTAWCSFFPCSLDHVHTRLAPGLAAGGGRCRRLQPPADQARWRGHKTEEQESWRWCRRRQQRRESCHWWRRQQCRYRRRCSETRQGRRLRLRRGDGQLQGAVEGIADMFVGAELQDEACSRTTFTFSFVTGDNFGFISIPW